MIMIGTHYSKVRLWFLGHVAALVRGPGAGAVTPTLRPKGGAVLLEQGSVQNEVNRDQLMRRASRRRPHDDRLEGREERSRVTAYNPAPAHKFAPSAIEMIGIEAPDTSRTKYDCWVGIPVRVSIRKDGFCYSLGEKAQSRQEAAKKHLA